jgi:hypothetical protein
VAHGFLENLCISGTDDEICDELLKEGEFYVNRESALSDDSDVII